MTSTPTLPPTMRAAVWHGPGLPLTIENLDTPKVERPGDVVVRVRTAMFGAALARAMRVGHPRMVAPAVLGTVFAGDVVAVGAGAAPLHPGQRVTIDPHPSCGQCPNCRGGQPALCTTAYRIEPGAHAEYVCIRGALTDHLAPIPDGVSYPAAMLTEIVACVLDATEAADIGPGQDVLVLGCGLVALIQIQLARCRGADRVFCAVNRPERAASVAWAGGIALESGERCADQLAAATDGRGADVVIEAVGSAQTYQLAFELVGDGGVVVGFGGCPADTVFAMDPNAMHYRRIRYVGSYHYRPGRFEVAAQLVENGSISVDPLITHRLPLARIEEALTLFSKPDRVVLVIEP